MTHTYAFPPLRIVLQSCISCSRSEGCSEGCLSSTFLPLCSGLNGARPVPVDRNLCAAVGLACRGLLVLGTTLLLPEDQSGARWPNITRKTTSLPLKPNHYARLFAKD